MVLSNNKKLFNSYNNSLEPESFAATRFGLSEGVVLEILWDIEKMVEGGRRDGTRSVTYVWWRAEVVSVGFFDGRVKAKLQYEELEGFKAQEGEVWVFPMHVRVLDGENTHLPWRFYESSGVGVQDNSGNISVGRRNDINTTNCSGIYKRRLADLEGRLASILRKHETMESFVIASLREQMELIGNGSSDDRKCSRLLSLMRQKTAVVMQSGIPNTRVRKDQGDGEVFFEDCFSISMKAEMDCNLNELMILARVIRATCEDAHFRPDFGGTQNPSCLLDRVEICFPSLLRICEAIGISGYSDLLYMAKREKKTHVDIEKQGSECAVRLLGTCVFNSEDENSPTAFLPCQGLDKTRLDSKMQALFRSSRDFDISTMRYENPLSFRECLAKDLIENVYRKNNGDRPKNSWPDSITHVAEQFETFTIRWRANTPPSRRFWTRSVAMSEEVGGTLEIEFPFMVFRGKRSTEEILSAMGNSLLKKQLHPQATAAELAAAAAASTPSQPTNATTLDSTASKKPGKV